MRNLLLKNFYKLKRNPSNVQVLLLAIIIILIIYILFGNQIISTAKNNLETTLITLQQIVNRQAPIESYRANIIKAQGYVSDIRDHIEREPLSSTELNKV